MAKESHDQKRKKKLAEERRKARENQSMAYLGERYKTEKLTPTWMHTEIGIYQTYVISDRKLLDQTVVDSIEKLIGMLRSGSLPPLPDTSEIHYEAGREDDLLIETIRRNWADHFAKEWQPSRDDLIGVLRSILGSIQKVKLPGPLSQSYLRHITGFLTKKLGVSVKALSADRKPLPEPNEGELVRLGRRWNEDGDPEARIEFLELASDTMKSGQVVRAIEDCHLLVSEVTDHSSEMVPELLALIQMGRNLLKTGRG